jgi:cytochrome c peroxidase
VNANASCHTPARGLADARPIAAGISGGAGRRKPRRSSIANRGYGRAFFWDARVRSLEEQVTKPIEDPNELGFTAAEAATRVGLSEQELANALASRRPRATFSAVSGFVSGTGMR